MQDIEVCLEARDLLLTVSKVRAIQGLLLWGGEITLLDVRLKAVNLKTQISPFQKGKPFHGVMTQKYVSKDICFEKNKSQAVTVFFKSIFIQPGTIFLGMMSMNMYYGWKTQCWIHCGPKFRPTACSIHEKSLNQLDQTTGCSYIYSLKSSEFITPPCDLQSFSMFKH